MSATTSGIWSVSGLMATFNKIWVDAWSARMEYILTNTLLALLEYPGATLLGVNRMYTDKMYRKKVVDNVQDPIVKDFWTKEFATYTDRYTQEATPAIQNKIGQFTGNPLIRNIIGQPTSSFDIRKMMDEKKIFIINLSKGRWGRRTCGSSARCSRRSIFLAAMSRAEASRATLEALPQFYFYVDEFQNIANETFSSILSESRKYKLSLTIAHQYIEQMEEEVRAAVFGNVGTTVVFRVGPFDAEVLETVFFPTFTKEDLVNLGFAQIYLTLMIDGVGSPPFSAVTLPPIEPPPVVHKKDVMEASRTAFGHPRAEVEAAIQIELAPLVPAVPEPVARPASVASRPPIERPQRADSPVRPSAPVAERPSAAAPMPLRRPEPKRETPPTQRPPVPNKSNEDLKSILRTMTAKNGAQNEQKKSEQQGSLKGALADALAKNQPSATPPQRPPPAAPVAPAPPAQTSEKKPFEVPEEALRKVLKGET